MLNHSIRRTLLLLSCAGIALLFAGCFDIDERVTLQADGSGQVVYQTIFDAEGIPEGGDMEVQETVASAGEIKREQRRDNNKLIHEEMASFSSLSELSVYDRLYRVEALPRDGFYRFTGSYSFIPPDAEDSSDDNPFESMMDAGMSMFAQMFEGRTFSLLLEFPGRIAQAEPAILGGKEYAPKIGDSWVSFEIPMKTFFSSAKPEPLNVVVDFEAAFALENRSVETVPAKRPETESADLSGFTAPAMMPGQTLSEDLFFDPAMVEMEPVDRGPSAEEQQYTAQIVVRNIGTDRMIQPAEVSGEIKNSGGRSLREVTLIVYALDNSGQPIYEVKEKIVNTALGDAPMRQNYSKRFRIDLVDVASDWSGQVRVEVDSVRFDH